MAEKILSACGNDCGCCPRFAAKTARERELVAKFWHAAGWRDRVVPREEIQCGGCTPETPCRYRIAKCVSDRGLENCGQCPRYPCALLTSAFQTTEQYERSCRQLCSEAGFDVLRRAFFEKRENLSAVCDGQREKSGKQKPRK